MCISKYLTIFTIAAALLLAACDNSKRNASAGDNEYGVIRSDAETYTDTTANPVAVADTIDNLAPGDPLIDESTVIKTEQAATLSIPPRRFTTKQEALDYMQQSGYWSLYCDGILPQMVEDNLEYADRLLNSTYDYFIVADKQSMHVILYDKFGHKVKQYPMAAARNFGTKHKKATAAHPRDFL